MLLKDCYFESPKSRCLGQQSIGKILLWGDGNNFDACPSPQIYHSDGSEYISLYHVHSLDLTVLDWNGNPAVGADITVTHYPDGYETIQTRTDERGKPYTILYLDGKLILLHKEWISGDLNYGVFDEMSGVASGKYHEVVVTYKDKKEVRRYYMDEDKTAIIQMNPYKNKILGYY